MSSVTRPLFIAIIAAAAFSTAARADVTCQEAANNALAATVSATTTLAELSRYKATHDNWCEGGAVMALEQRDADAVATAWSTAINAQTICSQDMQFRDQMTKLIGTLHNRRLRISDQMAELQQKCN